MSHPLTTPDQPAHIQLLADCIRQRGITMEGLARQAGMSRSSLYAKVAGERPLSFADLALLLGLLGFDLEMTATPRRVVAKVVVSTAAHPPSMRVVS